MTAFLLALLQASIAGSALYLLAYVIDKATRRSLTPAECCLLYLPALIRSLCIFTVPLRINKVIYGGPPAAVRAFLPDIFFSEKTHVIVVCCLLAVAAVLAAKAGWEYRKCLKMIRESSTKENDPVYNCPIIQMPFSCGVMKPGVYMPARLCGEERSYALKHEKAHLARHDPLIRLAASIAAAVHWFNPLAKGLQARLEHISELACDADAVRDLSRYERARYGHMLLDMFSEQQPLPCMPGLPKERKNITERIEAVTRPAAGRKKRWVSCCTLVVLLLVMVMSMVRIEALPVSLGRMVANDEEREMMDWLVEAVRKYEIPFTPETLSFRELVDQLMRRAPLTDDMVTRFALLFSAQEMLPVFCEVLKNGDTTIRGQLACAGLTDYMSRFLLEDDPIDRGMAEEIFELIREWRQQ